MHGNFCVQTKSQLHEEIAQLKQEIESAKTVSDLLQADKVCCTLVLLYLDSFIIYESHVKFLR